MSDHSAAVLIAAMIVIVAGWILAMVDTYKRGGDE